MIRCPKCGHEFKSNGKVPKIARARSVVPVCVECEQEISGTPLSIGGTFACRTCVAGYCKKQGMGGAVIEREIREREAEAARMLSRREL